MREPRKSLATECNKTIYIQTFTDTDDGEGGFAKAWADSASYYWAAVLPMRATQIYNFKSVNVEATHMVKIRGLNSIDESQRIRFGTRIFEVLTVEDVQEREFVKWVMVKERRHNG